MRSFPQADEAHLQAAVGWLELGNWREANEELERVASKFHVHPDVLQVRVKIYAAAGKWDYVAETAKFVCDLLPDYSFGPIHLAYALRQQGEVEQAKAALMAVVDRFPEEWRPPYLLSCYFCKLGQMAEAYIWLKRAIDVAEDEDIRAQALKEPDLEPLWLDLAEI